ncbi:serine/threonine-protein kinase [Actinomadura parmotrematis]|uniref:non-specific serine/threonine protein kinase n=1 Tax=Actinomadura parmotrematis TaxID=2864039 RepID=A0ABS7FNI6_9ACTN|nr:serine/threonine-protein kinase [Actinomadura parmotrematis]MBW8481940.1 protein kinase [Actinomadura parmotrematis]
MTSGPATTSGPAARCAQPDCTGTIAGGFCDLCGLAPLAPLPVAPLPVAPPAVAPQPVAPRESSRLAARVQPGLTATPAAGSAGTGVGSAATSPARIPDAPPSAASGAGGPTTGRTASSGGSTGSHRRGKLGAGLVEVPPVPYRDPALAVMARPEVPENRRICSRCDEPVGRSREGRPGRTEGFCRTCGHPFSFTPKLKPGERVSDQYEVLGCLAHGGLGWVYLARDANVSDRWVVLKGLLDTRDADSLAAATAERAFLAEVEHPNIVKIYNFVRHGGSGYIVMEYVGGESLKDILVRRRDAEGDDAALPLGQVIAYGLEVLQALGYLHGLGLLYCDFKPDNAIQSEEQLKLIDLGGVRRAFDASSPIFGTPGYQAPEIAAQGPSVTSDLYTVGRTLAVLSFPFRGYAGRHSRSLPPRGEVPLLQRYESYHRLLRRATHGDPARRFQSAAEMAEQLTGVLREVLSAEDGRSRSAPSPVFGPEQSSAGTETVPAAEGGDGGRVLVPLDPAAAAAALPVPLVYEGDPAAAFLRGLSARDPRDLAGALAAAPVSSTEVRLALARATVELGEHGRADALLDDLARDCPDDWRVDWYRGVRALAAGDGETAARTFDDLYDLMPGETAPKLALAFALEVRGRTGDAEHYYQAVWRTDETFVSAAFGLARARLAAGDPAAAERVLDEVPRISAHYVAAQLAAVATAVRTRGAADLDAALLTGAGRRLERLPLDTERRARFAAEILEAALGWLRADGAATARADEGAASLLGVPLTEPALRRRLERTYRSLAKLAGTYGERHAMVRRANAVRPRTLF